MRDLEDDLDTPFHSGDDVWFTEDGVDHAAEIAAALNDGFEYEVVTSRGATTAHLTQLRVR